MVGVLALWLPILVAAVFLFIAPFLVACYSPFRTCTGSKAAARLAGR
jgi:hypothetical protein